MSKYGAQSAFDQLAVLYIEAYTALHGETTEEEKKAATQRARDEVKELRREHDRALHVWTGHDPVPHLRKALKNDIGTSRR